RRDREAAARRRLQRLPVGGDVRAAGELLLHDLDRHPAWHGWAEPVRRRGRQRAGVTSESSSAIDILVELVKAPTVTPMAGPALDVLERHLVPAGFSIDRPTFSEPGSEPVENFFAAIGKGERHLTLAGHVDVVPPGPETSWRHPPFAAEIVDGLLYGRGAADMKGGLAAMVAAALRFVARHGEDFGGRLSFLVTGDEEGASVNGTVKLLEWVAKRGEKFNAAIVGEPTSARELGDQVKIGRRGSFSATIVV